MGMNAGVDGHLYELIAVKQPVLARVMKLSKRCVMVR